MSAIGNQYHLGFQNPDQINAVACPVCAFMPVRRQVLNELGLLDESFFLYGEDIDRCYRMKEKGWALYYFPGTCIIHHKDTSDIKNSVASRRSAQSSRIGYLETGG